MLKTKTSLIQHKHVLQALGIHIHIWNLFRFASSKAVKGRNNYLVAIDQNLERTQQHDILKRISQRQISFISSSYMNVSG